MYPKKRDTSATFLRFCTQNKTNQLTDWAPIPVTEKMYVTTICAHNEGRGGVPWKKMWKRGVEK